MTRRTSDFQGADQVRKVRPAQVKNVPRTASYRGGGGGGAAAVCTQGASAGRGEAGAPQRIPVNRKRSDGFDVSVFERSNKRAFLRLEALADGDDELLGFLTRGLMALRLAPKRGRPRRDLIETVDQRDRDLDRDELCTAISKASGERRQALFLRARALHSADERNARRIKLLRLWRDWYGGGMTVNKMVIAISDDLDRRGAFDPKSTGAEERNELIDKVIVCRSHLSANTIRAAIER